MRLLFLPQVYPPEKHPTAVMVHQLARSLVERGHSVTVACGYPHHPTGEVDAGYVKRPVMRETRNGVQVLRVWHATSTSRRIATRAAVMVSQTLAATIGAQLAERPDVVLNLGPPLVGPLAGALTAKRFGATGVTVIFDIYPDVAVSSGKVKNRAVIAAARVAERAAYETSDRIVVLSEGFRRTLVEKGVPANKVAVIPVWLDPDEIRPLPRETRLRAELGLDASHFVVLYAGTIGIVSGATIVPDAAALVRNPRVVFLFVGGGEALGAVQERVAAHGLRNVRFLPLQPRERLAEVQATADVGLVTLAPGMGRTSVPSKVLGYMAAGRTVLGSVDLASDTAACIERSGGVLVPPGDAPGLARAVDELSGRDLVDSGAGARAAFLREYTADVAIGSYLALFEELARGR